MPGSRSLSASTAGVAPGAITTTCAPLSTSSGSRRCATLPAPTTTTLRPVSRSPTRYGFSVTRQL